jgi:hypothetical protein
LRSLDENKRRKFNINGHAHPAKMAAEMAAKWELTEYQKMRTDHVLCTIYRRYP